jgi:UDP-N-acetylglucosamine 2-epimerase (non-hydrolysing)
MNRRLIARIASWHFAPTRAAAANLINEGHEPRSVVVTGNTVVDSLHWIRRRGLGSSAFRAGARPRVLVTLHRREIQGRELTLLCGALRDAADTIDGIEMVFPVHPNPAVRACVVPMLADRANVCLLEPLRYPDLVATLCEADLVITDSGGVLEEAVSQGVPVLVTRRTTERPEALHSGRAWLVGTAAADVRSAVRQFFAQPISGPTTTEVFGDGRAAERIAARLSADLRAEHQREDFADAQTVSFSYAD